MKSNIRTHAKTAYPAPALAAERSAAWAPTEDWVSCPLPNTWLLSPSTWKPWDILEWKLPNSVFPSVSINNITKGKLQNINHMKPCPILISYFVDPPESMCQLNLAAIQQKEHWKLLETAISNDNKSGPAQRIQETNILMSNTSKLLQSTWTRQLSFLHGRNNSI